jgi:hypothetical protein
MAGQLRKEWQKAKDSALERFKKDNPIDPATALTEGAPAYPLKFKEDLGPTLDDWEKAKTPADKLKHKNKAVGIATSYRTQFNAAKVKHVKGGKKVETPYVGTASWKFLDDALHHIDAELKK